MTTKTMPPGIVVVTLRLFDPIEYFRSQGFTLHKNDEAMCPDLLGPEMIIEFKSILRGDEENISISDACGRANQMGNPGGVCAWARFSESYHTLSEDVHQELRGKELYFFNTIFGDHDGNLCVPCLNCNYDSCERHFRYMDDLLCVVDLVSFLGSRLQPAHARRQQAN